MSDPQSVIVPVQKALRRLVAATVALFVAIAIVAGLTINIAVTSDTNASINQTALCALKADEETQVNGSTTFLVEHPKGIPGVPIKVVEAGIKNTEQTIEALSILSC